VSSGLIDNLPEALKTLRTQALFVMRLDVRKLLIVGATPGGYRRVNRVVAVGIGHRQADGPIYSIFEVL
jgi:hypothetical protein